MPRSVSNKKGSNAPSKSKSTKKGGSKKKADKKSKRALKKNGQPRRWHSGTVALREIRKLQKSSNLLIQKAPFQRMVRLSMEQNKAGLCFKPSALEAVQEAAENYLVSVFEGAVILQIHRNRKTLNFKDLNYTQRIRGEI